MPIVTIQLVTSDAADVPRARVQQLADDLGALFGSGPGGTWVRVCRLPRSQYAENDTPLDPAVQPTFVEVLKGALPDADALAREAERVAQIVAERLARPRDNTHVLYLPPGAGRIAFGGTLVRA